MSDQTGTPTIDRVAVIGLGYVGLPLAVALADHVTVTGYDIDHGRIDELESGYDRTREIAAEVLSASAVEFINDAARLGGFDAYLITVPTPVDDAKKPDLTAVTAACRAVGAVIRPGAVVVVESTVYPGTVEGICGPIIAAESGLVCGRDFFLGYSPERINPGDVDHRLGRMTKVVAGQTAAVTASLVTLYGRIGPVFEAVDIRTAEAAKVIENAQRDINIAFVNELAVIFNLMGLDTGSVLETARTKWNFLNFQPGLVGGHCIGVDPYYLTYRAEQLGYRPEVILAGRRINDSMGRYVGIEVARQVLKNALPKRTLVLGIAFKENVPDIRNSGSVAVIREIESFGIDVDVHDPLVDPDDVWATHGLRLAAEPGNGYGAVVLAVGHEAYADWAAADIEGKLVPGGVVADVRGLWRNRAFADHIRQWRL